MNTCNTCKNWIKCQSLGRCIKKKKSKVQKAKEGKIQVTIPEEKEKALKRDGYKCIYCGGKNILDFHHVRYGALERIYDHTRNLYYNGVILCRACHRSLTDGDKTIDSYCREYLKSSNIS